jgi:Protein of unknown function (DUF3014)
MWVLVVLAAIGAGVLIWRKETQKIVPPPDTVAALPSSSTVATPVVEGPVHPIELAKSEPEPAKASTAALPTLDASDGSVADTLQALVGGDLASLMLSDRVILRIVATVDALPRQDIANGILPLHTPKGAFLTEQADGVTTISDRNAERYAAYMQMVENTDTNALVGWYVQHYPLFQQAYRELGYPHGYFNDRLIAMIDDLLAAPVPAKIVELVKPRTLYQFSDPSLQSLSVGQKLLIRMGPDNAAQIKEKLRSIRSALIGEHLRAK